MRDPRTLLVLSPSTGGYYFGALLTGLVREVAAVGGRIVLVQTLEPGGRSDALGEPPAFGVPVHWAEIDGAVAITTAVPGAYLAALQQAGTPVVVASNRLAGLTAPSAVPDNRGGTVAAVDHLVGHGHREIGFVGNLAQSDIAERHAAFGAALAAHGLAVDSAHRFPAEDNSETGGDQAAAAFLASSSRPTAVVAGTDRNAMGFLRTVAAAGVRVPHEVAVVGFDNIEASAYTAPTLTTVDQPFGEIGALAARLVLAQIAGEAVPAVAHPSPGRVVVRNSCGCGVQERSVEQVHAAPGDDDRQAATAEQLTRPLLTGDEAIDTRIRSRAVNIIAEIDRLLQHAGDIDGVQVDTLTSAVRALAPRPGHLRHVARVLNDHAAAAGVGPQGLRAALWHLEAASFLAQSSALGMRLDEQFGVDDGLLDGGRSDPRDLSWLQGTHVVSGVLGLWDATPGSGSLHLAGVHGQEPSLAGLLGTDLPVEHFPPSSLVQAAHPDQRQVCIVVPLRTSNRDWGLLALVAEIETTSAHETYHHWAALLASALDERALQEAVQASEERYAFAALAAKDGLWEWDGATGDVYVSDRSRQLLGLDDHDSFESGSWTRHVVADDIQAVQAVVTRARSAAGVPVEVEFRVTDADGTRRWVLCRCVGVGPLGQPVERLIGSLSDIHTRKELEEQLRHGALYDDVTGLPNRRLFLERLTSAVQLPRRRPESRFAVIFMDLDGFKLINDSLGHLIGDDLLRVIGDRLRRDLRTADTAARFGGDEFAVLLSEPRADEVLGIAQRIQERLAEPIQLGDHEVTVTASIGIATSETNYVDPEDVLRDADIAMYHAKTSERGSASVFDAEMHARASGRLRVRGEIRAALAQQQFVVHYQPIVALDGSVLDHFEALVRWDHPERGLLMPGSFLSAMEDDSSIVALGQWVLDEVCRQIAVWRDGYAGRVSVSVNLSNREFWSEALLAHLDGALARHRIPASSLILEITESVIMDDLDAARRVMADLQARGVHLHIDDFGTGQSSLHALRTFPVDALKIDGSFIRELGVVDQTTELVRIILEMGRVLGLEVVAECVETEQQADRLRAMGCRDAQGWLYAKAMPGDLAGALLGTRMSQPPHLSTVAAEG